MPEQTQLQKQISLLSIGVRNPALLRNMGPKAMLMSEKIFFRSLSSEDVNRFFAREFVHAFPHRPNSGEVSDAEARISKKAASAIKKNPGAFTQFRHR